MEIDFNLRLMSSQSTIVRVTKIVVNSEADSPF